MLVKQLISGLRQQRYVKTVIVFPNACIRTRNNNNEKGKPDQSQGRKVTGPRFLREAMEDLPRDPKPAGLRIVESIALHRARREP